MPADESSCLEIFQQEGSYVMEVVEGQEGIRILCRQKRLEDFGGPASSDLQSLTACTVVKLGMRRGVARQGWT